MTAPGIDPCSLVPLFVEPHFGDQKLSRGATAFLWLRPDSKLSLLTNWHVATGRNSETGACIRPDAAIPDHLRVHVPLMDRALPPLIVNVPTIDADHTPLWVEHPDHGREVDVVSLEIELPPPSEASIMPMNALPLVPLKQRVGMPVFILGYPFGRKGAGFPVWKQGSFASEPYMTPDLDLRYLIVDSASRPGMSGSPVIQRVHGEMELEGSPPSHPMRGDGVCNFIGVYSGRFHTNDENDAQLGRVWPKRLVEEIISEAIRLAN